MQVGEAFSPGKIAIEKTPASAFETYNLRNERKAAG
jgi:hypothetical protein